MKKATTAFIAFLFISIVEYSSAKYLLVEIDDEKNGGLISNDVLGRSLMNFAGMYKQIA